MSEIGKAKYSRRWCVAYLINRDGQAQVQQTINVNDASFITMKHINLSQVVMTKFN